MIAWGQSVGGSYEGVSVKDSRWYSLTWANIPWRHLYWNIVITPNTRTVGLYLKSEHRMDVIVIAHARCKSQNVHNLKAERTPDKWQFYGLFILFYQPRPSYFSINNKKMKTNDSIPSYRFRGRSIWELENCWVNRFYSASRHRHNLNHVYIIHWVALSECSEWVFWVSVGRSGVVGSTLAFGSIGHEYESEQRLFSHLSKLRSLVTKGGRRVQKQVGLVPIALPPKPHHASAPCTSCLFSLFRILLPPAPRFVCLFVA